jgi:hypothetical protein
MGDSWLPNQTDTDTITSSEWNEFAQCLLNVSGNAIHFSSNSRNLYPNSSNIRSRFPASGAGTRWAELTGLGVTTLHSHPGGGSGGMPSGQRGSIQYASGAGMDHGGSWDLTWDPKSRKFAITGTINISPTSKFVQGFSTPSASVYIQSGLTVGRRTKWGQWCGMVNVLLDPSDGYGYRQALLLYADKDNVQGSKLYGINATAMGNNPENIALYGYAAEGTSKNWGLLIDEGNAYIRRNLSSQSISSARIINKGYMSSTSYSGNKLYAYQISCAVWKGPPAGGGSGTPGGLNTNIQFNESSTFGGDAELTWNTTTKTMNVAGSISSQVFSSGRITNLHLPYDYVVYRLNGKYYNKRGSDGLIYSHEYANNVIQNAIDGCGGKGGRIAIMSGNYYLIDNINIIDKSLILEGTGTGWDGTIGTDDAMNVKLTARNDSNLDPIIGKYMISCSYNGAAGTCIMDIEIRGLSIWGNQQQGVKGGIVGANLQHSVFENLWIGDFWGTGASSVIYPRSGIGLMLKGPQAGGCYYNEIRNVEFRRNTTGLFLSGNCNANQISNCHWDGGDRSTNNSRFYGIFINGAASNIFIGPNDIDDYTGSNHYAIYISGNEVSDENATLNTFFGQRLEGNYHNIYIADRSHGSNWFFGGMCYSAVAGAIYWEDNEANNPSYTRNMDGIPDKGIRAFVSASAIYGYTISCNTWKGPTIGGGGISNVVEDTTPQLGGDLDGNTHGIIALTHLSSNKISGGTFKNLHYPADYVIWKSGSKIYSRKGSDGSIYYFTPAGNNGAEVVIQDAIDGCPAYGGRIVLMSGAYDIRNNIRIYKAITLEGSSIGAGTTRPNVKLYYPLGGMGYPIERGKFLISCSRYELGDIIQGVVIRNIFLSPNQNGYVRGGIIAREAQHCIFENLFFNDFYGSSSGPTTFNNLYPRSGIGILLVGNDNEGGYGNYYNIVRDCEFRRCTVGLMVSGNSNAHTFSNNHFNGGHRGKQYGGMYIYGIFNWAGDTNTVIGSGDFEDYSGQNCYAVYMASGVGGAGWNFFGQRFEGNTHDVWISYSTYDGYHKFFGGGMNDTTMSNCPAFAGYTDKFLNTNRDNMRSYVRYVGGLPNSGKDIFVSSQKFSSSSIRGNLATIVGSTTSPGYLSSNRISTNSLYGYTISCHTWKGPPAGGGGASNLSTITIDTTKDWSDYGINNLNHISSNSISSSKYTGKLYYPVNYVIYKDDSTYYSKKVTNGRLISSSTSPVKIIQGAINDSPYGIVSLVTDISSLDGCISGAANGAILDLGGHSIYPGSQFDHNPGATSACRHMFYMTQGFHVRNADIYVGDTGMNFRDNDVFYVYGSATGGAPNFNRLAASIQNIRIHGPLYYYASVPPICSGNAITLDATVGSICTLQCNNITVDWLEYLLKIIAPGTSTNYCNCNMFDNIYGLGCDKFFFISANMVGTANESACDANLITNFNLEFEPNSKYGIYCNTRNNYFQGFFMDPTTSTYGWREMQVFIDGDGTNNRGIGNTIIANGCSPSIPGVIIERGPTTNLIFDQNSSTGYQPRISADRINTQNIYGSGASNNSNLTLKFGNQLMFMSGSQYIFRIATGGDKLTYLLTDYDNDTALHIIADNAMKNSIKLNGGTNNDIYASKGKLSRFYSAWGGPQGFTVYHISNQTSKVYGGGVTKDSLYIYANSVDSTPYIYFSGSNGIGINTNTPTHALHVTKGGIFSPGISSQGNISGQHITPIFRGGGKPSPSVSWEGKIVRTSGMAGTGTNSNKTYVWICVHNSTGTDGGYEWIQLGVST